MCIVTEPRAIGDNGMPRAVCIHTRRATPQRSQQTGYITTYIETLGGFEALAAILPAAEKIVISTSGGRRAGDGSAG